MADTGATGERVRFLRESTPLAGLPDDVLAVAAEAMRPVEHAAGSVIIRQGEPGRALHVLADGGAEVRVRTETGGRAVVARMGRGDCFGEMALLSGEAASADVVAAEGARTLALEREEFDRLVEVNPRLLRAFVLLVTRRLHATTAAMATAREKGEALTRFLQDAGAGDLELVGKDKSIKAVEAAIAAAAPLSTPLLIQGERGTGKELVARLVHFRGPRKGAPLLCADCKQIAETQWGDHLFGPHARGADRTGTVSYLELAQGGTLLLKNVEKLPPPVQERLGRLLAGGETPAGDRPDVRVLATTAERFADLERSGAVAPELARALAPRVLVVPPLRTRKRDVPLLASKFVEKHAKRQGKKVAGIEDLGVTKLVSYDYAFANVRELEQAVERAVALAEGETIKAEEIFLGVPPRDEGWRRDLLKAPRKLLDLALAIYPGPLRILAALSFLAVVVFCFAGPADPARNPGTILGWAVWWPAMALSFVFAARAWCAVCPLSVPGTLAQRFFSLKRDIPTWVKKNDNRLAMTGFFLIVLVEETTDMRHSPFATGLLLVAIMSCALASAVLWPRRTWCRHLCPLGGFASVGATGAVLELRPTPDICAAKCREHACYKGTAKAPGCPLFQHVMFVESNRHCVLCLDCVRNCPNGSPQLNLRAPARELYAPSGAMPGTDEFTAMLAGLVLALAALRLGEAHPALPAAPLLETGWRAPLVALALLLGAGLPLLLLRAYRRRWERAPDPLVLSQFNRRVAAWLPLVGAAFAAFQIAFAPGLAHLLGSFAWAPPGDAARVLSVRLLPLVQGAMVLAGALVAGRTLRRLAREAPPVAAAGLGPEASLVSLGGYAVAALALLAA